MKNYQLKIEEMLSEAVEIGKLTNKNEGVKNRKRMNKHKQMEYNEDIEEHINYDTNSNTPNKINLHDFKAILKWENN
jgi:hypothetical protein